MAAKVEVEESGSLTEKRLRVVRVDGAWDADCDRVYREAQANAIIWRPPRRRRTQTCDVLLEHQETLRNLSVIAGSPVEDSAISAMKNLSGLRALTRAMNPLDLSSLHRLSTLELDDRASVTGLAHRSLVSAAIYGSRRKLGDFEGASQLDNLKLEGEAGSLVDMQAHLPALRSLVILNSGVRSLDGFVAPRLEWLRIVDAHHGAKPLDVSPLARCSDLKGFVLASRGAVTGLAALTGNLRIDVRLGREVTVDREELDRLPQAWREMNITLNV